LGMFKQKQIQWVHDEFDKFFKKTCSLESTVETPKIVRISILKFFFKIKQTFIFPLYSLSGFYLLKYFGVAWATEFHLSEDLIHRNLSLIHPTILLQIRSKDGEFKATSAFNFF
jgi:hypothetical protein